MVRLHRCVLFYAALTALLASCTQAPQPCNLFPRVFASAMDFFCDEFLKDALAAFYDLQRRGRIPNLASGPEIEIDRGNGKFSASQECVNGLTVFLQKRPQWTFLPVRCLPDEFRNPQPRKT